MSLAFAMLARPKVSYSSILLLSAFIFSFTVNAKPSVLVSDLHRRQNSGSGSIKYGNDFGGFFYTVNISVGTPPQQLTVVLDTGSNYLIISNPESDFCSPSSKPCSTFGFYDPTQSNSAIWFADDMAMEYELTKDSGSWFTDTINLGEFTVPNFPIGTANGSLTIGSQNWFGVGSPGGVGPAPNTSSLQLLAQAEVIESASISIFSGPLDASIGEVVFGGIDTSKWKGNLQVLPIEQSADNRIVIKLSSIGVSDKDINSTDLPVTVLVDTGNFDIKLPQVIVDDIWYQVGGIQQYNATVGDSTLPYGVCDCGLAQNSTTFSFGFGDVSIAVPISDMVVAPPQAILQQLGVTDFPEDMCIFMINGWGDVAIEKKFTYILGDAFLRSAYFVLDWDSNEVGLGQANNDDSPKNIIPIAAGISGLKDAVASASGANSTVAPTSEPSAAISSTSASSTPSHTASGNSAAFLSFSSQFVGILVLSLTLSFFL